jgi:2-hydroxychromene-2-carboxylate isomerase
MTMSNGPIDFWFAIGSTYTFLSVMRIDEVSRVTGVSFRWRPFSVRTLMREMDNIPFSTKPFKAAYMWRDIERRAQMYGLKPRVPAPYPLKEFDWANQVAVLGMQEGWGADYVRATYRRWFEDGEEPGMDPNLSASLKEVGEHPGRAIARAELLGPVINEYRANTDEARALGIFGAPTFVVGQEFFWGDDRMEDAISWAQKGVLSRRLVT